MATTEIHPGEILLEDFMKPMGITAREISAQLGLPEGQLDELLRGARPITADIAARLGRHFRMESGFWLNLQAEYDRRVARRS